MKSYPKVNVRHEGQSKIYKQTHNFWETRDHPDRCGLAVGCFADPTYPAPVLSEWEESKHIWLQMPAGIEHAEFGVVMPTRS